jgi:hypothetical protein
LTRKEYSEKIEGRGGEAQGVADQKKKPLVNTKNQDSFLRNRFYIWKCITQVLPGTKESIHLMQ